MAGMLGFKVITQFEQGIVFRWGRVLPGTREPGLTWVNPFTDRLRKVNMQVVVAAVPAQEAITRDNVTLKVDAVVYYRVVDPFKAIINVQTKTNKKKKFKISSGITPYDRQKKWKQNKIE